MDFFERFQQIWTCIGILITSLTKRKLWIQIFMLVFRFSILLNTVVTTIITFNAVFFCRQFYDMHIALVRDRVSTCLIVFCLVSCILLYLVSFTDHRSFELTLNNKPYKQGSPNPNKLYQSTNVAKVLDQTISLSFVVSHRIISSKLNTCENLVSRSFSSAWYLKSCEPLT